MPSPLTVDDLKKLLKRKHKGRARGIMARIEEAEGRADKAQAMAQHFQRELLGALAAMRSAVAILESVGEDPEPPTEHPDDDALVGASIASNVAQDIASWPITSRITRVEITEQQICVFRTPADPVWPTIDNDGTDIVGNVLVGAYIDGVLHVGTYEWKRPNQQCKALTPEVGGGTIATRIGPHVEARPLVDWVPKAGEKVIFWEATLCRYGAEKMLLANGQPQIPQRTQGFETTWSDFETDKPTEPGLEQPPGEYLPDDIHVPAPGTSGVLSWPVVVDVDMTATLSVKGDIELMWVPTLTWRSEQRSDIGPAWYYGNSGMIYHSATGWHAIATEWMRIDSEKDGTYYPLAEKFVEGPPTPGMPIGKFVAGLWRHTTDHPRHHRRTNVSWFNPKTWTQILVPDFTVLEQVEATDD